MNVYKNILNYMLIIILNNILLSVYYFQNASKIFQAYLAILRFYSLLKVNLL